VYRGPRTEWAGLVSITWPVTSQSKSMRIAARCCLTEGGDSPVRIPLGAVWKKNGLYSGVVSKFVATLSEVCAATV
jgi:hypothetical protein